MQTPTINPLHPPHKKGETNDIIRTISPLTGTQKHPHESDNSHSDKEAPFSSVAEDYGISSDHLTLVVKFVELVRSFGWIGVRKKKGRRDPHQPTQ